MEKRNLLLLIMAIIAILAVFTLYMSAAANASSQKYTVVASGHPNWWPTMGQTEMTISGTGSDVAKIVCDDLGFNFKSVYAGSWSEVQEKLKTGELDLIVAMYWTEERAKEYVFSVAYTTDPITPFVAKGKTFPSKKENLLGKKGVVTKGDSYGQELDKYIIDAKLDITVVDTAEQGFSMVKQDKVDYFLYSAYAGRAIIVKENISGIEESGTISEQPFYMAAHRDSPIAKRMNEVNASLRKQMADPNSSLNRSH